MTHKADKIFLVEYRYANAAWTLTIWADDLQDAERKLRALATNGRVIGQGVKRIVLPNWFGRLWTRIFGGGRT